MTTPTRFSPLRCQLRSLHDCHVSLVLACVWKQQQLISNSLHQHTLHVRTSPAPVPRERKVLGEVMGDRVRRDFREFSFAHGGRWGVGHIGSFAADKSNVIY